MEVCTLTSKRFPAFEAGAPRHLAALCAAWQRRARRSHAVRRQGWGACPRSPPRAAAPPRRMRP
eukprot:6740880-Prymnesium_polylepis.1